ncbi:unnamed protein product [Gongylonema pulchrum]|uniref:Aldo_ket_red domain-containing protein n=1 Tax=Gongylonema pulchrum TaxID=637853 RepID=A0A183DBT1_9BILA|nr:unnamed protein product [Gongylonema pulchrum]
MTPSIKLNSGHYIPSVGLGTWLSPPGQVGDAVKIALNNGYEHIDCAHAYRNQVEIGDALADIFSEGKIKRQNIFITSKIWNTFHSYQMAKKGMDMILGELRLDYLDLCLIHWPHGYEEGSDFYPKVAFFPIQFTPIFPRNLGEDVRKAVKFIYEKYRIQIRAISLGIPCY